jgi:hypothetical protein
MVAAAKTAVLPVAGAFDFRGGDQVAEDLLRMALLVDIALAPHLDATLATPPF